MTNPSDEQVSVFICGGMCRKDGKPHEWNGRTHTEYWEDGGISMQCGTCSKCGMTQFDYDVMHAP